MMTPPADVPIPPEMRGPVPRDAGPELDAMAAAVVMGWPAGDPRAADFHPSSVIAAAWRLVETFRPWHFKLFWTNGWLCDAGAGSDNKNSRDTVSASGGNTRAGADVALAITKAVTRAARVAAVPEGLCWHDDAQPADMRVQSWPPEGRIVHAFCGRPARCTDCEAGGVWRAATQRVPVRTATLELDPFVVCDEHARQRWDERSAVDARISAAMRG